MAFFSKFFKKKLFKDPVCGMGAGGEIVVNYKDRTYYFCSGHCREQFQADPQKYINEK